MNKIESLFVKENYTIKEVMRVIDHTELSIALIVDEKKILKGIITDGDIRRALQRGIDINAFANEIMNKNPITVKESLEREEIIKQIDKYKKDFSFLKIPLVDDDGKVKNIAIYSFNSKNLCFLNEIKSNSIDCIKTILIVGGAGYLGSVLCRKLLNKGYKVRVLDILMFGEEPILEIKNKPNFELIQGDMRNISTLTKSLDKVDAVIHLAAIVGDPASRSQPTDTIETNYLATMTLAQACKYHQINRFVFASTCSVYGVDSDKLDEDAELNPISLYARSKIESEKGILSLTDENFAPTILRMGTLYGLSPRMRFDLVVNVFAMKASVEKEISLFGGDQWRPLLNVEDAADAYIKCIEAPIEKVKKIVFNVGSNKQNYQIKEISNMVKKVLPETIIKNIDKEIINGKIDKRDYRVSFDKIKRILGFNVKKTVKQSLLDIHKAIESGKISNVNDPKYYNSG